MGNASSGPSASTGGLSLFAKVRCPHCGTQIPRPFYRAPFPVVNTHWKSRDPHGPRCRVVVVADPTGERHAVHRMTDGETDEHALERIGRQLAA